MFREKFKKYALFTQIGDNRIQSDKALEVLMRLGLTELQAKTYLALVRLGKAEVGKIAKHSNIARQDIYRIIPKLEKLGLVEKIISTPILYKAVTFSEGTSILFRQRTNEYASLKNSIKVLMAQPEENSNDSVEENSIEFVITSEKKRFIAKLEKAYSEATHIDIMVPGNAINLMIFYFYDCLSYTLTRGAKVRVITQNMDIRPSAERKFCILKKHPNFEVKFVNSNFGFGIAICDNTEINIAISDKEVPSLWTNNRQILRISQLMFEDEWNASSSPEFVLRSKFDPLKMEQ